MKKYIVLAILTMFMLVSFSAVYAEDETQQKVYGLLTAMDIIKEKDVKNADEIITRGEFASMAAGLVNYSLEYDTKDQKFSDVPPESAIYDDVMLLAEKNVLRGVSAIKFAPENNIGYNDACAVLVRLLGYGSPEDGNYQYQAANIGLLDNVKVTEGQLLKKDAMRMIYNALFAQIKFGNSIDGFTQITGFEVLMEKRFNIYEISGVLTDDGEVSISGASSVGNGNVMIDNHVYENKSENMPLIGTYIEGFVRKDGAEEELIYMCSSERKNQVVEFTEEYIKSYADEVYNVYINEDMERTKKYVLAGNYKLIYNNRALQSDIAQEELDKMLKPEFGNVKLIDNDNDNEFDVVIVEDYETVVIKGYSSDTEAIYNILSEPEFISFKDIDTVEAENADGIYMDITSIEKYNVASVMISEDKSYARMIISTQKASGVLNGASDNNEKLTIGDKVYEVAPELLKYLTVPSAGTSVNIYLRHDGKIAYIESTTGGSGKYAYLDKVYINEDNDGKAYVRIYTEDNEIKNIPLAEKVVIDGKRYKDPQESYTYIKNHPYALHQLILVKINEQDEVTNIDCAYYMNDTKGYHAPAQGEDEKSLHVAYDRYNVNNSITWVLGNTVGVSEQTKIFVIPSNQNKQYTSMNNADLDNIDMSQIKVSNINAGDISNGSAYPYIAYIRDENTMVVEAIVLYRNVAGWDINITYNADTRLTAIVTDVIQTVRSDGELCWKIMYTTGGSYGQVYTATLEGNKCKYKGTEVKVGDIIKYGTDKSGRIPDKQLVIMYSPSTNKDKLIFADGEFKEGKVPTLSGSFTYGLLKGKVIEMNDRFVRILRDNNTKRLVSLSTMRYIVFDGDSREKVRTGAWSDISTITDVGEKDASVIIFDWNNTNINWCYVIK